MSKKETATATKSAKVKKNKPTAKKGNVNSRGFEYASVSVKGDGCAEVARASEGVLDTDQVRLLRAMRNGKTYTRQDLMELVGIGRGGNYSGKWAKSLRDLGPAKLVKISVDVEGGRAHLHTITQQGKKTLEKYEKLAKS